MIRNSTLWKKKDKSHTNLDFYSTQTGTTHAMSYVVVYSVKVTQSQVFGYDLTVLGSDREYGS